MHHSIDRKRDNLLKGGVTMYWARICKKQRKQAEKGLRTYGKTLEENRNMTLEERIDYLEEELIDALMYMEHIKELIRR